MSRTSNLWRPDTCGCEFALVWDTDIDPDAPLSTTVTTPCPVHAALSPAECYAVALAENQTKNQAEGVARMALPALANHTVDDDGNDNYEWKPGVLYTWAYSPDHTVLTVRVSRASAVEQVTLQAALDAAFGPGGPRVG